VRRFDRGSFYSAIPIFLWMSFEPGTFLTQASGVTVNNVILSLPCLISSNEIPNISGIFVMYIYGMLLWPLNRQKLLEYVFNNDTEYGPRCGFVNKAF
jgi:predicted membrane protein